MAPLPMVAVTVPPNLMPIEIVDAGAAKPPQRPLTAGVRRRPPAGSSGGTQPANTSTDSPPVLDPQKPPQLPPDPFGTPE
jgi:hypothetical protein